MKFPSWQTPSPLYLPWNYLYLNCICIRWPCLLTNLVGSMIGDWSTSVCHESNLLQIWLNHTNCPLCLIGDCVHGIFNTAILYFVSGCAVRRLAPSVFSMLLQHKYSCVTNILYSFQIHYVVVFHTNKRGLDAINTMYVQLFFLKVHFDRLFLIFSQSWMWKICILDFCVYVSTSE